MAEPQVPALIPLRTLSSPSGAGNRAWQSLPHPSNTNPLLATAVADKTVNIWSLRDFSLVSTITGGHKRSVRTVDWKDYGRSKKRRKNGDELEGNEKPVTLATGSFDANVGIWVRNDDSMQRHSRSGEVVGGNAEDEDAMEMEMSRALNNAANGSQDGDEDEEWHFSTLLTGPDSEIKSVSFSPAHYGANLLATSSRDKSVWVWEEIENDEWETIAVLGDHTGDVKCVAWCQGAVVPRRLPKPPNENDAGMDVDGTTDATPDDPDAHGEGNEDRIVGSREILASSSYDDTVRLWRDVEEEGDWLCVGVIEGHSGTVWGVNWEKYINYDLIPLESPTSEDQFENDWEPRLLSCSDDKTIRLWRRQLSEAELEKKNAQNPERSAVNGSTGMSSGFMNQRLPSIIRPSTVFETWTEETILPKAHVRSVYAIDWSKRTGLVVSCGGDGTIAVYKEFLATKTKKNSTHIDSATDGNAADIVMQDNDAKAITDGKHEFNTETEWKVVALIEAAHDEYEINHICWALRKDRKGGISADQVEVDPDEEVIVSTGDDGDVKIWCLPENVRTGIYP